MANNVSGSSHAPPGSLPYRVCYEWKIANFQREIEEKGKLKTVVPISCLCPAAGSQQGYTVHNSNLDTHFIVKDTHFIIKVTEQNQNTNGSHVDQDYIGVHLRFGNWKCGLPMANTILRDINMGMEMTILGSDKNIVRGNIHRSYHYNDSDLAGRRLHGWTKFASKQTLFDPRSGFIIQGRLHLRVDIIFYWQSPLPAVLPVQNAADDLLADIARAYNDRIFPDSITLQAGDGTSVQACKWVLSARSEVFRAMFAHATQEQSSNLVKIQDVDGQTLSKFVEYMFLGRVSNLSENALKLLIVADKYLVNRLKSLCTNSLIENLLLTNVIQALMASQNHNITPLKNAAFAYIKNNSTHVTALPDWEVVSCEPTLMAELVRYLSSPTPVESCSNTPGQVARCTGSQPSASAARLPTAAANAASVACVDNVLILD